MKKSIARFEFVLLSLVAVSCFYDSSLAAETKTPRRISSKYIDMGKPQTIYMVAGMATLIELPTTIQKIRIGNSDDVQYTKPDQPENEVTLFLKSSQAKPTNLFLISGKNKYIFDIVPSKTIHQDYIEVVGAFGGPDFDSGDQKDSEIIDSSELPVKTYKMKQEPAKKVGNKS